MTAPAPAPEPQHSESGVVAKPAATPSKPPHAPGQPLALQITDRAADVLVSFGLLFLAYHGKLDAMAAAMMVLALNGGLEALRKYGGARVAGAAGAASLVALLAAGIAARPDLVHHAADAADTTARIVLSRRH